MWTSQIISLRIQVWRWLQGDFTHLRRNPYGRPIWADMANIIWASGLQVTAAWYVVTETDSALRQGANVTGTIMLVLRKRHKQLATFRDDLG